MTATSTRPTYDPRRGAVLLSGLTAVLLAGCEAPPPVEIPLLGGYRDPADQCRLVGENEYTNQFLDHTSDLVGCPEDAENLGVFVTETGATQVGQAAGYILYTVPRE